MSFLGRIQKRVRAATSRGRLERDMQDEMREHIAQAAERFQARGMSEADALAAARREFGNVGVLQEQARDARGARWIESVVGDLRHAMRQFARAPLFALTIVLTLTLGIGVSAATVSVLSGILTRPAPGMPADPTLVAIRGISSRQGSLSPRGVSYPELLDYAALPQFSAVAGWTPVSPVVSRMSGDVVGTSYVTYVTPNFFRTLGLSLSAGNTFVQRELADHSIPEFHAIIGYLFALKTFGSIESAVGKRIQLNGINVEIIGVAPARFLDPFGGGAGDRLWLPLSAWPVIERRTGDVFGRQSDLALQAAGRLRGESDLESAGAAVAVVAARAGAALEGRDRKDAFMADVAPLIAHAQFKSGGDEMVMVGMIVATVILILLLCTTTVSSLLVGAAMTRRQEIAVRLALGAGRRRIIRQLLTENVLLATVAGALGLSIFAAIARALRNEVRDVNIDPTGMTALVTAGIVIVAAVLCGLSPALHATRDAVSSVLKDSSATATVKSRLQRVFVVAQVALTQPLLIGLAMTIAVLSREASTGGATRTIGEHVVEAAFDTWSSAARNENRLPEVMARISALPGVLSVMPQRSGVMIFKFEIPATATSDRRLLAMRTHEVPPGYFRAMDVRLIRGREFTAQDSASTVRSIVVGSDFAREILGDEDPIGKRMATVTWDGARRTGEGVIVGVVDAADVGGSEKGTTRRVFTPMGGKLGSGTQFRADILLIRTDRPAESFIPTFREIARSEAPMLPVRSMKTLAQQDRDMRTEVFQAAGASAVGGLITLFLAAVGLYAVVALSVSQRRREIGVRVSIGASPRQVVAHFFKSGLRVSLLGLMIGLPLSAAALKLIGSQVGVPRTNMPAIAAAVALTVIIVASLASWIPARRAAGVDPLIALREG